MIRDDIDFMNPVNLDHPINTGLVSWLMATPNLRGGLKIFDLSRRKNGTLTNMPPATSWVTGGRPGGWSALNFVKANSTTVLYPEVVWPANAGPISVAFWIKTAGGEENSSWGIGSTSEPSHRIHSHTPWSDNVVYWDYGASNNGRVAASFSDHLNKWTHVTLVASGSSGNFQGIYYNGTLANSEANSASPTISRSGLRVGSGYADQRRFSTNQQDDFRLYDRLLSGPEVRELYDLSRRYYPGVLNRISRAAYFVPVASGVTPLDSQSLSQSDSPTATITYVAAPLDSESLSQSESPTATHAVTADPLDSQSISESESPAVTIVYTAAVVDSESLSQSESPAATQGLTADVQDSQSLSESESPTATISYTAGVTDSQSLSESESPLATAGETASPLDSESLSQSESPTVTIVYTASPLNSQSLSQSESPTATIPGSGGPSRTRPGLFIPDTLFVGS